MTKLDLTKAVTILRAGGLVAFPTETVYGLGADAANDDAIEKIFKAKERPKDHPLIVHIAECEQLNDWALDIPQSAYTLAKAFWPGPLTLILNKKPHVSRLLTGGQDTIGLRIPNHPIAKALLQAFKGGIAAPSANKFTHLSPTTAAAVKEELGEAVDLILDGGDCAVGLESTIIDMSGAKPVILRPGMLTAEAIADVLGEPVLSKQQTAMRAPGMHPLHYAPLTKTRKIATNDIPHLLQTLTPNELPIAIVLISKVMPSWQHQGVTFIPMPLEAKAYAHDLYRTLRLLDHEQFKEIFIESVPYHPEWEAICDRIEKATGAR